MKTILLIDDEPDVLFMLDTSIRLSTTLRIVGMASDAAHALKLCREQKPDFIILDLMMPKSPKGRGKTLDAGIEIIERLHTAVPGTRVAVYTAADTLLPLALEHGADAVFSKTDIQPLLTWLEEQV